MKFLVLRDTREKDGKGWKFNASQFCSGTLESGLKTGDYTLLGYEDVICLERKGSIIEWANNMMQERFFRELERMEKIRYPFILLEFSLKDIVDYPYCEGVPFSVRKKIKVSGAFLLRKLCEIQLKYKVKIILCGDKESAKSIALSLFKRIVNETIEKD